MGALLVDILGAQLVILGIVTFVVVRLGGVFGIGQRLMSGLVVSVVPPLAELKHTLKLPKSKNTLDERTIVVPRSTTMRLNQEPLAVGFAPNFPHHADFQRVEVLGVVAVAGWLAVDAYVALAPATPVARFDELNLGLVVVGVAAVAATWSLLRVCRPYLATAAGGRGSELFVFLIAGILGFLCGSFVLFTPESVLEFDLDRGHAALAAGAAALWTEEGDLRRNLVVSLRTLKLSLTAVCALCLPLQLFGCLRLAKAHVRILKLHADAGNRLRWLAHQVNFLLPLLAILSFAKPLARDLFPADGGDGGDGDGDGGDGGGVLFDQFRLALLVACALVRLAFARVHLQAHLDSAWTEVDATLATERNVTLARVKARVLGVAQMVNLVSVQYAAPPVLALLAALCLKTFANLDWLPSRADGPRAAALAESNAHIYYPLLAGVAAFCCWWIWLSNFLLCLFGYLYHQVLVPRFGGHSTAPTATAKSKSKKAT